jgi:hypothetical protein
MVEYSHSGGLRLTILLFLGKHSYEVWIDISLALLAVDQLAKKSKINRYATQTGGSTVRKSLCLPMMMQELLRVGDVEERQRREGLSSRLLTVYTTDRKFVEMKLEELPQGILGAALWDIANVNLHGYTRSTWESGARVEGYRWEGFDVDTSLQGEVEVVAHVIEAFEKEGLMLKGDGGWRKARRSNEATK